MKKKVLFAAILVSALFTTKSFMSTNQSMLVSDNIEAISEEIYDGGDLPEVEIVCGAQYGFCWEGFWRPLLGWKCPTFTGKIYDCCLPNMG